jgi:transcriptional regulator with XRE-family HTH domain
MNSRKELLEAIRESVEYWQSLVSLEVQGDVQRLMKDVAMSQAELAERIGSSEAYVSKILNANTNFTIQTLIKLARALEAALHVRITRPDEIVQVSPVGDVVRTLEPSASTESISARFFVATEAGFAPENTFFLSDSAFQPKQVARA